MRSATSSDLQNRIAASAEQIEEMLAELQKREWAASYLTGSYHDIHARWVCTQSGKAIVEAKAMFYTLEPQDACVAHTLALSDLPVTALLAAAYLRGDVTNKAMIAKRGLVLLKALSN